MSLATVTCLYLRHVFINAYGLPLHGRIEGTARARAVSTVEKCFEGDAGVTAAQLVSYQRKLLALSLCLSFLGLSRVTNRSFIALFYCLYMILRRGMINVDNFMRGMTQAINSVDPIVPLFFTILSKILFNSFLFFFKKNFYLLK